MARLLVPFALSLFASPSFAQLSADNDTETTTSPLGASQTTSLPISVPNFPNTITSTQPTVSTESSSSFVIIISSTTSYPHHITPAFPRIESSQASLLGPIWSILEHTSTSVPTPPPETSTSVPTPPREQPTPVATPSTSVASSSPPPGQPTPVATPSTSAVNSPPQVSTSTPAGILASIIVSVASEAATHSPAPTTQESSPAPSLTIASPSSPYDEVSQSIGTGASQTALSSNAPALLNAGTSLGAGEVATISFPATNGQVTPTISAAVNAQQNSAVPSAMQTVPAAVSIGSSAVSIAPVIPVSSADASSPVAGGSATQASFVVGSQTIAAGQTFTINNTPVEIQTSAGVTQLLAGSSTIAPSLSFGVTTAPTASSSQVVINGQTLDASAPIVTLGSGASATVVSLATDSTGGVEFIQGSSTIAVQSFLSEASAAGMTAAITQVPQITAAPTTISLGGEVVSLNSAGAYQIGSQSLTPGQVITEGTGSTAETVALETSSGSTQLVVQGSSGTFTSNLPVITRSATATSSGSSESAIVVNGHTYEIGETSLNAQGTATTLSKGVVSSSMAGAPAASSADTAQSAAVSSIRLGGTAIPCILSAFALLLML